MGLALKALLGLSAVLIASLAGFSLLYYLQPLATTRWLRRRALLRAGFQQRTVSTTAGSQTVLQAGNGPLVVLLHGAGDEAGTWYKVAPELKRRYAVVAPDLAGHGKSDPPTGPLSLGVLLAALEQLLDSEPWRGSTLTIVGNSLGAWLAMLYAHRRPERVKHIVLVGGGPIKHLSEIDLLPKTREEARRAMEAVLDPSYPKRPNFVLDDLVRVSNTGPISRLFAAGEEDLAKYLLEDQLGSFTVHVDLIWGASDRLVPVDYAKRLQALLPDCTLTVIDRCGHAPQLERPKEFTAELQRVLANQACHTMKSAKGQM